MIKRWKICPNVSQSKILNLRTLKGTLDTACLPKKIRVTSSILRSCNQHCPFRVLITKVGEQTRQYPKILLTWFVENLSVHLLNAYFYDSYSRFRAFPATSTMLLNVKHSQNRILYRYRLPSHPFEFDLLYPCFTTVVALRLRLAR